MKIEPGPGSVARLGVIIALLLPLNGCLVAGYSSGSGFWMWPGSVVITLILILWFFLTRRH